MSDLLIRTLAANCAAELCQHVDQAVADVVRQRLPATIERILRRDYAGETLRLYVSKKPVSARRDRDEAIRLQYTGHNVKAL
ncbi:MAG: hypothetical protein JNM07_15660, partial [Phycisphaerae bacterium]|nr:hypothetical protein [Phycisphaerae bacterium]